MGGVDEAPKKRGRPRKNPLPESVGGVETVPVVSAEVPDEAVSPEPVALTPAQVVALDRDGDGEAGGSLTKAALTAHEMAGFVAEFYYAHSMQEQIKRVDSFNRVWTFSLANIKNHMHMTVMVKRGPVEANRMISASFMPQDKVEAMLRDLDAETTR